MNCEDLAIRIQDGGNLGESVLVITSAPSRVVTLVPVEMSLSDCELFDIDPVSQPDGFAEGTNA